MMITLLGRHITEKIRLGPFLISIYGFGKKSSRKICRFVGLAYSTRIVDLDQRKISLLSEQLENKFFVESDLKRFVADNLQHRLKLRSYRGLRLSQGLPSRGQRTKTNSRTVKKLRHKSSALLKIFLLKHVKILQY